MQLSTLARLTAVVAAFLPLTFGVPTSNLKIRNADATDVVPNSYIVIYNEDITAEAISAHEQSVSSLLTRRDSTLNGVGSSWFLGSFKGYAIETDVETLASIAAKPEVSKLLEVFKWDRKSVY